MNRRKFLSALFGLLFLSPKETSGSLPRECISIPNHLLREYKYVGVRTITCVGFK